MTKGAPPVVLRMAHNYAAIREALEAAVDDYACLILTLTWPNSDSDPDPESNPNPNPNPN